MGLPVWRRESVTPLFSSLPACLTVSKMPVGEKTAKMFSTMPVCRLGSPLPQPAFSLDF